MGIIPELSILVRNIYVSSLQSGIAIKAGTIPTEMEYLQYQSRILPQSSKTYKKLSLSPRLKQSVSTKPSTFTGKWYGTN